jgi:hypothetical protein
MPVPWGRRPSIAALIRDGARKAIDSVRLTCRALHFCLTAICSMVDRPETISSSHCWLRAMARMRPARRSRGSVVFAGERPIRAGSHLGTCASALGPGNQDDLTLTDYGAGLVVLRQFTIILWRRIDRLDLARTSTFAT